MRCISILSKVFIIFFLFLFIFNVYSLPQTLTVTQETTPDKQPNSFYVSRYDQKEIIFNINTDYSKKSNSFNDPYIQIKINNIDSQANIDFKISTTKLFFNNNLNTSFYLTAVPNNYKDTTTRVSLSFNLYDEFDNLLDTQEKYFYFVSNNSEVQYLTETGEKPTFLGYTFSKNNLSFIDINDFSVIDVNFNVSSNDYKYHLICETTNFLKINVVSSSLNSYQIKVSLDKENLLKNSGKQVINCVAKDKYETHELKPIYVVYHVQEEVIEEVINQSSFLSGFNISKFTGFLHISFFEKIDLKSILVVVIVVMILGIIFVKK
jgi:hypothetical protein